MIRHRLVETALILILGVSLTVATPSQAGTILKLTSGNDSAFDVQYDAGILHTVVDGDGATTGAQDTAVEFLDFLSFMSNITTPPASYTLSGLTATGPASVIGGALVSQEFTDGVFTLYDDLNFELLSFDLTGSILTGAIGPTATGAVFSTTFGTATSGSLLPLLSPNTISMSMSLNNVNLGSGFTTSGIGGETLDMFAADATIIISALQVPEPGTLTLAFSALILGFGWRAKEWRTRL